MFYALPVYFISTLLYKTVCSQDDIDPCLDIRERFAIASADFTSCSITNSRPITLCEKCIHSYINVLNAYNDMSKIMNDNETTCLDRFINLDRLQIVQTQFTNSMDLWSRGKCYECYVYDNGIPTNTTSNETNTFLEYFNNYQNCTKEPHVEDLCNHCMEHYVTLHDYYLSISNSNEKISMCIDLVDLMNTTWSFWSNKCCIYRRHNEYIFILSTVGVFLVTIFFYVIVKFSAEKRAPTLVQQTRFAESVGSFTT